jgi:hypothetical protein
MKLSETLSRRGALGLALAALLPVGAQAKKKRRKKRRKQTSGGSTSAPVAPPGTTPAPLAAPPGICVACTGFDFEYVCPSGGCCLRDETACLYQYVRIIDGSCANCCSGRFTTLNYGGFLDTGFCITNRQYSGQPIYEA